MQSPRRRRWGRIATPSPLLDEDRFRNGVAHNLPFRYPPHPGRWPLARLVKLASVFR